jgi:hypothetical protein
MAEDRLRTIVDGIRTRLQTDLETQLGVIAETQEHALAEASRAAEAAADQRWAAKLEATRRELTEQMQAEVAAARSEVERTMVAESLRGRIETEQAAADAASRAQRDIDAAVAAEQQRASAAAADTVRSEIDRALAGEREQAQQALAAERQRAGHELTETRAALEAARAEGARSIADAQMAAAFGDGPQPQAGANAAGLLAGIRAIDDAVSLSDALAATVRAAALEAPRVVLFIVNGTQLQEWPVAGVRGVNIGSIASGGPDAGLLGEVVRRNETMSCGRNGGPPAPAFAALPPNRIAVAIPFVLGGRPVAVLYADEGTDGEGTAGWQEAVQILGRHAAAYIAYLTAMRSAQAVQAMHGTAGGGDAAAEGGDEAQGARRYARLLVSEIKLYNEDAVRHGRDRRDLLERLKPEIARARRLYDERVPASVQARDAYFHQELVQTLADGDQSLLG